jgi:hypothetical protein
MVDYTPKGRIADYYGVDWHSEFRNKATDTAFAVGDVLYRDATDDLYKKGVAASVSTDWVVVLKACAATTPTVEVLAQRGVPVSLVVGTGATIEPHDFVKLDDDNELVPWVAGTDAMTKCIGQYNQGTQIKGSATVAFGDATAGQVIYIELGRLPFQDLLS